MAILGRAVGEVAPASASRSFWGAHQKGFALLPAELRDDIIASGAVVLVRAVRDGQSKFGPTWFTDVEYAGDIWTIAQSHNEVRDRIMLGMRDFVMTSGPLPATIQGFETASGPGFDLAPPPDEFMALDSGDSGPEPPRSFTDTPF